MIPTHNNETIVCEFYAFFITQLRCLLFFFFNDTATTEIYTLSLHDALPIFSRRVAPRHGTQSTVPRPALRAGTRAARSEEHTSELQSPCNLVCRLLLEKKKIFKFLIYQSFFILPIATNHLILHLM